MDTDNMTIGLIRTPFSIDIPHAFVYNDTQTTKPIFCGPYMETVKLFAQVYHYKLQLDEIESLPKKSLVEQSISNGVYNLSLHGVLVRSEKEEKLPNETEHSYPLELMRNCVMVPLAPELPKWMYVVWPLGRYIWTTLFLGIFYIAFLLRYVHWRDKKQVTNSFTQNCLYALALLMYSPNMNMNLKLSTSSVRVLIFYTLLYILGFILSNYHISHMTVFDMKPVFVRPINTWGDLIASRLRIIIPDSLLEELRWLPVVDISPLENQFEPRIWQEYQELMANPSRSYAYVVTQDNWVFFNRQQRVLIQPYFHLSQVCFGGLFNSLPMSRNASFAMALNRFVLNIWQAGLWDYWQEVAFQYSVKAGYARIFLDTYNVEPLNLEFFNIAWLVLIVGFPVSFLVYFLEYLWFTRKIKMLEYKYISYG